MAAVAGSGHWKGNRMADVAKSRIVLLLGQSLAFTHRYSRTLVKGWYFYIDLM